MNVKIADEQIIRFVGKTVNDAAAALNVHSSTIRARFKKMGCVKSYRNGGGTPVWELPHDGIVETIERRILRAAGNDAFTSKQIAGALGMDVIAVSKRLFSMKKRGLVEVVSRVKPSNRGGNSNVFRVVSDGKKEFNHDDIAAAFDVIRRAAA